MVQGNECIAVSANRAMLQVFAFTIGFYALDFAESSGYDVSFGILAMVNALTVLPLVFLVFHGLGIRKRQGTPHIHQDL